MRGYAFESLGVKQGDAIVGGRYYAVASVEVVHWIDASWGIAAFVDAGNATDTVSRTQAGVGYGVGARLRTPIGPFRLDVAYGEETRKRARPFLGGACRFERGRRTAAAHAPRAAGHGVACSHWSSLVFVVLAAAYVFLGSQAALDYVVRRAVAEARRPSRRSKARRVRCCRRCASRASRGTATRSTSRRATPRSPGRRSISCRASSSCRAWARSACRSTSRKRTSSAGGSAGHASRCRSRSTCATSASSGSIGGPVAQQRLRHRHHLRLLGRRARTRDPRAALRHRQRHARGQRRARRQSALRADGALTFEGDGEFEGRQAPKLAVAGDARAHAASTPAVRCAARPSRSKPASRRLRLRL